MKFQADREVLSDAISFVVRMLSPKPQLPQLSGVMITAKDNAPVDVPINAPCADHGEVISTPITLKR